MDKFSFLTGCLVGRRIASQRGKNKTPVAYLYGHVAKEGETPTHTIDGVGYVGEVWPDIRSVYTPELQAKYPYAIMLHFFGTTLFVFPENADYYYSVSGDPCFGFEKYEEGKVGLNWWLTETENGIQWIGGTDATDVNLDSPMVWSNFDLYTDSTRNALLLAASEPIPIYE